MHFLNETVVLDERDSFLTISGDPDDDAPAWISGGAPLAAATTAWARWADVPNASCVWSRVVRVRSRRAGARARVLLRALRYLLSHSRFGRCRVKRTRFGRAVKCFASKTPHEDARSLAHRKLKRRGDETSRRGFSRVQVWGG